MKIILNELHTSSLAYLSQSIKTLLRLLFFNDSGSSKIDIYCVSGAIICPELTGVPTVSAVDPDAMLSSFLFLSFCTVPFSFL